MRNEAIEKLIKQLKKKINTLEKQMVQNAGMPANYDLYMAGRKSAMKDILYYAETLTKEINL